MSAERPTGQVLYTVLSAQAGAASEALLRAIAAAKLDDIKKDLDDALKRFDSFMESSTTVSLDEVEKFAFTNLVEDGKHLIDLWKAGLGLQMGTAIMGLYETYTGYPQLLGMYKLAKWDASVRPRLQRYFLKKYFPALPRLDVGFDMMMKGDLARKEWNILCEEEGWEKKWHDKLYSHYTTEPDIRMGFTMYKRGLIKQDRLKWIFRANHWDPTWDPFLEAVLHRRPNLRQLTTISDYVVLPDLYIRECLRADGLTEGDINYLAPAIQLRPLREEVRSVAGRYLWQRQIGRLAKDALEKNLKALGLLPKEVELDVLWAELRYADEQLDEQIDTILQRFKKRYYDTREEVVAELLNLKVLKEKANIMAENWYWTWRAPYFNWLTIATGEHGTTDPVPGKYRYVQDTDATVTAIPDPGYVFDKWIYNETESAENPITLTMDAYYTLTPYFKVAP